MAQTREETTEIREPFEGIWHWRAGGMAGLAGSAVTGAIVSVTDIGTLQVAVSGLYGLGGSLLAGWVAHLLHGALFGLLFAAALADPALYRVSELRWKTLAAGVVYAVVLAVFGAGIVMPIWLGTLGMVDPPPIPYVTDSILVWHLVYGAVLGGLYPTVERR